MRRMTSRYISIDRSPAALAPMIHINEKLSWPTDYCSNDHSHYLPAWATQPLDVALVAVALPAVDIMREELGKSDKEGRSPDFEVVRGSGIPRSCLTCLGATCARSSSTAKSPHLRNSPRS